MLFSLGKQFYRSTLYITRPKQFKSWLVSTEVSSIVVAGALKHSVSDLKAAQMNKQCSLIWELMLYEFKLGNNAAEATKNVLYKKWRCS